MSKGEMKTKIQQRFLAETGVPPVVFRSPGRINLIGEHTDYNNGFVLPAAIDKAVYVAVAPKENDSITLFAENFSEKFECRLDEIAPVKGHWANYILGVVDRLKSLGYTINGFTLMLYSDIPVGAGLSSSAAVGCATAFALNDIFSLRLSRLELALIAQRAEQVFSGVMCGIMDQFASLLGKQDHLIKLDCRSLAHKYVPFDANGLSVVLLNTNVKHELSSSEYNSRRSECEEGVTIIKEFYPEVESLRDVSMEMLKLCVDPYCEIYRRCKYVIMENERLLSCCKDLEGKDFSAVGKKMYLTHRGLSRDFGVSCLELDFLVDAVKNNSDVLGARMMGAGFGGCTINLVRNGSVEDLVDSVSEKYKRVMGRDLSYEVVSTGHGTSVLTRTT